ncbi:MAG TPA: DUF3303 family protein [Solirubrobacteraceae bacterium]|jgi:hypothetical protein
MLYMVVERDVAGPGPVYERAATHGRMLPEGVRYVDSWIVDDDQLDRCFQLMETDDLALLDRWRERWSDLVEFDVLPIIKSDQAAARVGVAWRRRAQY